MPDELENGRPNGAEQPARRAEQPLDPELQARRRAALARIRSFGDPALRTKARDVELFDESLALEIERMSRIMMDALGVGLAATQLGVMHRLLVYRASAGGPLVAVVNPLLEWSSDEIESGEEGCLSLPDVLVDVERPLHVRVGARDARGDPITIEASGLEARVIQHEIDHLDGVLILDRTTREQRKEALRVMREGPRDEADSPADAVEASPA